MTLDDLHWHDRAFDELTVTELYAIMALRAKVFVVEQAAAYQDLDGWDQVARHVWAEVDSKIVAYLRIVPAGTTFDEVSIGRVITAAEARGLGLGRVLMRRGLAIAGDVPMRIGAQSHLERFYNELGFVRASDEYIEDNIPHIEMTRSVTTES